jgi:hypothetical protein
MTAAWTVNVQGLGDYINRMKRFDSDIAKHLQSDIKVAVDGIYKDSQQQISTIGKPLSRWGSWSNKRTVTSKRGLRKHSSGSYVRDLSYDPSAVKAGIKKSVRVLNKSDVQDVLGVVSDTTAAGAGVTEPIGSTAVLLRLIDTLTQELGQLIESLQVSLAEKDGKLEGLEAQVGQLTALCATKDDAMDASRWDEERLRGLLAEKDDALADINGQLQELVGHVAEVGDTAQVVGIHSHP